MVLGWPWLSREREASDALLHMIVLIKCWKDLSFNKSTIRVGYAFSFVRLATWWRRDDTLEIHFLLKPIAPTMTIASLKLVPTMVRFWGTPGSPGALLLYSPEPWSHSCRSKVARIIWRLSTTAVRTLELRSHLINQHETQEPAWLILDNNQSLHFRSELSTQISSQRNSQDAS